MDFEPHFKSSTRSRSVHHFRDVFFRENNDAVFTGALLNSSLFFIWFISVGNGRNITGQDVEYFPEGEAGKATLNSLAKLFGKLMNDYKANSIIRERADCEFQEFRPSLSKPILDEIDFVLAQHYGFTEEELDFIVNYDIKYRLGADASGDED